MPRILISYRREDTAGWAGRLYDRLVTEFGQDSVFMDIDTIEPGMDFVEVLEDSLEQADVVLVMIGQSWIGVTGDAGNRRLDNPRDWVRLEVATALKKRKRVMPVLVEGAVLPTFDDLPDDLAGLARRQALEISDARFHSDVDRLIRSIQRVSVTPRDPGHHAPEHAESTPASSRVAPGEEVAVGTAT